MASWHDGPLLVFGPRSLEYDFGPRHPLSPRRFGPGIDLLRAVGAEPGLAPETATDAELGWLHADEYIRTVRRFSADPSNLPEAGIGPGDDPAFAGMHEAGATVAGGSIRAVEAILRGDVEHAYQPGGGLHHAMRAHASGFCIYNDVALAIARARREGLRVLYVDLDVHHGDGVQALHYDDPGVLTISFHETGRSLFPGTGFVNDLGEGTAAGTAVNVPLEPMCGPGPWLDAIRAVVPPLAAAFGPDMVVSQHGADGHVWDPLAHLSLTTTSMGQAARLVDKVAHRYCAGRWFATGGGGYAIYRVVPRVWALTWLAGAHGDVPGSLPAAWRARWDAEAARWGDWPLPEAFEDDQGLPSEGSISPAAAERAGRTVSLVRTVLVPALLSAAEDRGWWHFDEDAAGTGKRAAPPAEAQPAEAQRAEAWRFGGATAGGAGIGHAEPTLVAPLTLTALDNLAVAPGTMPIADPAAALEILRAALRDGAVAMGAVGGERLVGVALAAPADLDGVDRVVALGVAPESRRGGLAAALLAALVEAQRRRGRALIVLHTVAERDPLDPLPRAVRREVAERLVRAAGMTVAAAPARVAAVDPESLLAVYLPPNSTPDGPARIAEWSASL